MIPIQKLSKISGISVRTLRYYEEIGLLIPASKTDGGHRLYEQEQLLKLQQILFLKNLGFKLKEVKNLLKDSGDWSTSLKQQLSFVREEQIKLKQIENTLVGVQNAIAMEGDLDDELLQKLIRLTTRNVDTKKEDLRLYFNEEEQQFIQQLPNVNRNDPDSLEWMGLLGQLMRHQADGPSAPKIQRVIRRIIEKSKEIYGENNDFLNKIWSVRKSSSASEQAGFYPLDEGLLKFIEEAFYYYEINNKELK